MDHPIFERRLPLVLHPLHLFKINVVQGRSLTACNATHLVISTENYIHLAITFVVPFISCFIVTIVQIRIYDLIPRKESRSVRFWLDFCFDRFRVIEIALQM